MQKYKVVTTAGDILDLNLETIAYIQTIPAKDEALTSYKVSLTNGNIFFISPDDYAKIDSLTNSKNTLLG